jgi:hypothetical protein
MRLILTAGAIFLFAALAQANTLSPSDAQKLHSLRAKLYSANVEITQAMDQASGQNPALVTCLGFIHDQAQSVAETAAAIDSLAALAVLMQDSKDETLLLRQLKLFLSAMTGAIPNHREIINRAMAQCSTFAIVTVKGQAMLNIFSELNEQVASMAQIVARTIPSRQ